MNTELTLRDYVDILRRRIGVVIVCLIGAVVLALLWSALQTPMYQSSARILINQNTATDIFDPVTGIPTNAADRAATNEVELLRSQLVQVEAEARLGYEATISARVDSRSDVLIVTAVDADAARAQTIAQTYAEAYLDVRRSEFVNERLDTAERLLGRIVDLDLEIEALQPGESAVRQQALRDDLADSYDRLNITADLGNNGSARIIDDAELPEQPFSPRTFRNLALGAVLGLMLGAGGALLLESLDQSIKTRQILEGLTPGVATLTSIPVMKTEDGVLALNHPEGADTEVFRTLRAGIEFASVDRPLQVIQITSPGPSAGKTTVAANLAVVMARSGLKVAVVDGDLRRPRLHDAFDIEQVPGISSVIIGREKGPDVAHSLSLNNGRLWVFPSGPLPPGPSELLGSERALRTFTALRKSLDVIILDSPPVLPVADALVISRLADATVLVANAKSTSRDDVLRAMEQLEQAGANVIGTVLNQVSKNGIYGHGYGYGYGYGYGGSSRSSPFRRSKNEAPRLEGTATLATTELPQFKAARSTFEDHSPDADVSFEDDGIAAPVTASFRGAAGRVAQAPAPVAHVAPAPALVAQAPAPVAQAPAPVAQAAAPVAAVPSESPSVKPSSQPTSDGLASTTSWLHEPATGATSTGATTESDGSRNRAGLQRIKRDKKTKQRPAAPAGSTPKSTESPRSEPPAGNGRQESAKPVVESFNEDPDSWGDEFSIS